MTRKRFFVQQVNSGEEYVNLTKDVARHIENVLRLKPGDPIELRDGCGNGWNAVIAEAGGGLVRVQLLGSRTDANESPLGLTLAMALARSDRMELVVRQATEIGVQRFVVFRARRSQYGLSGNQIEKRAERWSRIAREALCQCGRDRLPQISFVGDVSELIVAASQWSTGTANLKILACEEERERSLLELKRGFPTCGDITAVVGSEGGWTVEEVAQFERAGYHTVHLGPRILRFETAAVALLSSVQLLWGDFGGMSSKGVESDEMS